MNPEQRHLAPLATIPVEGRTFTVSDAAVWTAPVAEFGMDCRFTQDPELTLTVLPLEQGWLLKGHITASAVMPCSRCAKDTTITVDADFEDYAEHPVASDEEEASEPAFDSDDDHIVEERGVLFLDLAAIAWEQFMLGLPEFPLCRPDCKGLCPHCGMDLNEGQCTCSSDTGDPRLAILRGLKIAKKQ